MNAITICFVVSSLFHVCDAVTLEELSDASDNLQSSDGKTLIQGGGELN